MKRLNRRCFLYRSVALLGGGVVLGVSGCRGTQKGRVMRSTEGNKVGSHQAGAEVFRPIVCETTDKLLAKAYMQPLTSDTVPLSYDGLPVRRVCFIELENKTNEEIGDFKEQLEEIIDTKISDSTSFTTVSPRAVKGVLRNTGFRPDDLFLPVNMATFSAAMQQEGAPFEYLLFGKLTSGTTVDNIDKQKDYMLTLEMVNVNFPDDRLKESTMLRKEYMRSARAKTKSWLFF
ncbi:MAG: penicillin-binding protein activator LpoB [Planctomycetaceae bacterium]|nr:penicillin-binding protein activator LpoB [Planctomycetaceae bacterium]